MSNEKEVTSQTDPSNLPSPEHPLYSPVSTRRQRKSQRIRSWIQWFFVALVLAISANHALEEAGVAIPLLSSASLHAICPFGGVVTLWKFLTTGTFIQKIHASSLILMSSALLLGILFGPVICGWVCPFGTVQEWLGRLGRRLFGKRYNNLLPRTLDSFLRSLRYLLLVLVVFNTAVSGKLIFQAYDPYYALFNFWSSEVALTAFLILGITLLLSLAVERPWCKYACPYGAFLGLTNLIRFFPIRRNAQTCISCSACDKACPMNLKVSTASAVRDPQCISCMKCTSEDACPIPDTVEVSSRPYPHINRSVAQKSTGEMNSGSHPSVDAATEEEAR